MFTFATRLPREVNRYLTFSYPLQWQVWLATATVCLAMFLALHSVGQLDAELTSRGRQKAFNTFAITFCNVIGESVDQRFLSLKVGRPTQILLATWVPMACVMALAYQSNLFAALMKADVERPVDSFQDVVDRDIKMYIAGATLIPFLLKTSPRETDRRAFADHGVLFQKTESGDAPSFVREDVLSGKGVISNIPETLLGYRHIYRLGRNLQVGSFPSGYYFGMGHPMRDQVNFMMQVLIDVGMVQRLQATHSWKHSYPERQHYRKQRHEPWRALDMEPFLSFYLVGGVLLSTSVLMFGVELGLVLALRKRLKKRSRRFGVQTSGTMPTLLHLVLKGVKKNEGCGRH